MTTRTRSQLNGDADTNLADNSGGDISAADVRQRIKDLADSALLAEDNVLLKAGGTLTGPIVLAADPSASMQPATKQYVDNLAMNVGKRSRIRVMDTSNSDPATSGYTVGATIDGITLIAGDLVGRNSSSNKARNGVWVAVVSGGAGRAPEFDTFNEHPGTLLAVEEGTTYGDTLWLCTTNEGGTLGSTSIDFTQLFFSAYTAGNGILVTGQSIAVNAGYGMVWTVAQTFINSSGIKIQDTDASHTLGLILGSNLTANRTLTITPGDASRSISLGGDLTFVGAVSLAGSHAWTGAFTFAAVLTANTSITFPVSGTLLSNSLAGQQITGGALITINDLGSKSSGTVTPNPGDRPHQKYTNAGAHTLAPGSNYGDYVLDILNASGAGAITTSGWTSVTGDAFTTATTAKFRCFASITADFSTLMITKAVA